MRSPYSLTCFTDSHAHLSSVAESLGGEALGAALDLYAQAQEERATAPLLLDPGTEPDDLGARIALLDPANRRNFLRLAAGVWPSPENLASPERSLATLEASIAAAAAAGIRVTAIGEGGLDYHYPEGTQGGLKAAQAILFAGQLELAKRLRLPMIVHSREAFADTIALVSEARPDASSREAAPVLIHCFGYGCDEARAFLASGCWLSFAGNLTYRGSDALRSAICIVPENRLLLETDSPYMNPSPRRGKPTSPLDIERTYAAAAIIRGESIEKLAEAVACNARALFH